MLSCWSHEGETKLSNHAGAKEIVREGMHDTTGGPWFGRSCATCLNSSYSKMFSV